MPRMKPADMEHFLQYPNNGVIATLRQDGQSQKLSPFVQRQFWIMRSSASFYEENFLTQMDH